MSTEAVQTFNRIQNPYPFIIKILNKMTFEGTYLSIINAICSKPTANSIHKKNKLKFPLIPGTR